MKKIFHKNLNPLVSVLIPVYNGSKFIGEAVESILNQTYANIELIVVNDGSKDNTQSILNSYLKIYPHKLKLISYKKNKGESAAANVGFLASKGDFIARMDADDISYPERIKAQVEFMLTHPEVIVVGSQANVIDENGNVTGKKTFPCDHKSIYNIYSIYHPMLHPSCMFRRSLLPYKNKLWENIHEPNDDYYTLFGLLNHGQFANLPEKLVGYRIHSGNKSLQNARSKVFHALQVRIDAVRYFGYKPPVWAIFINLVQFVGALILPERLIVTGYFALRGMASSSSILKITSPVRKATYSIRQVFFAA